MHTPVLMTQVLENLNLVDGSVIVDCNLGAGGHAFEILKRTSPDGMLIGFDHDQSALNIAKERLKEYKERVIYINENFKFIDRALNERKVTQVDGILFDLGVSLMQLQNKDRGFSFQMDGPLDMRMDKSLEIDAQFLVNTLSLKELSTIIFKYGEEKWAKKIAFNIIQKRDEQKITDTLTLAEIIKNSIPKRFHKPGFNPATLTFQALRIVVNDELNVLKEALEKSFKLLKKGGRLCVISFHSLEDRIVKNCFKEMARGCICVPESPICNCNNKPKIKIITRKPIVPGEDEVSNNPRSRSSKLRVCEVL